MAGTPGDACDGELCERVRRGEGAGEAFAILVARHQPAVSRFAARWLGRRDEADDVVQETFLRAWQQIGRFKPGTNFLAWILAIARFLCMARLKESQRHPTPAALAAIGEQAAARENTPRDYVEKLREAYASLPFHQREILSLRLFDGLSYRDISAITGRSEVALRSRMHDALARLKSLCGVPPGRPRNAPTNAAGAL